MKKRVLMSLVLLIAIGTSAVFAQTINGLWRSAIGNVFSIYDGKSVFTEVVDSGWKEAEKRGNIGIGSSAHRNIRSTGNLTWSGQWLSHNPSTHAVSWQSTNATFTMSPDGKTMQVQYPGGTGSGTWTRISNNEIDGLWRSAIGNVFSIYDGKSVFTEVKDAGWKEAEKRGNIGIGSSAHRNIRSTGNLTWSGQWLSHNPSTHAVSWQSTNATFTMSPDGKTMQVQYPGGTGSGTWTRLQ